MIKNNVISGLILFLILALNGLGIYNINKRYVNFLTETLLMQDQQCGEHMENTLLLFSNDINKELDKYTYSEIFGDPAKFQEATQSLRMFYTKYRDLITNISVYDDKKNFYALYLDTEDKFGKEDYFLVDSFPRRYQLDLNSRHRVEQKGSILKYYYPYFGQDVVNGNVMVEVDIERFANGVFKLYPLGNTVSWQWVLDADGKVIISNFNSDSLSIGLAEELRDSVANESSGIFFSDRG